MPSTALLAWHRAFDGAPPLDLTSWRWVPDPPAWRDEASIAERLDGARFLERTLTWTPGALDDELRLCADDRLASLTVYSEARAGAFCPYDGGMDLILRSPDLVDAIRRSFPDWVSTHPAGL